MKTKTKTEKFKTKDYLVIILCILIPAIIGFVTGDLIIGGSLLITGLLGSYFAGNGKRINYLFGFINALLIAYVAYENNLFGSFFVNTVIFTPLEIYGFLSWSKNLDKNKNVKARKFTLKKALIITSSCILGSIIFGYILSLIPGQNLAFADSTMCCLDISALTLMNLRYKEAWWIWVVSGALAVAVWIDTLIGGGANALMRLIAAIGFLAINIYGAIKWNIMTETKKR